MPSWNIHLEAGRRIADKLKWAGKKRQEFLFGCLLPDINNGYINKRVKEVREHEETHWAFNEKSSLNFYEKYRDEIERREPIYLGYLFHLYTDGFFNYDFYRKVKRSVVGEGLDHAAKRKIKHNDFWKYNIKYKNVKVRVSDKAAMAEAANQIKGVWLDEDAILEVEELLDNEDFNKAMEEKPYLFYTEEKLDALMDEMCEHFAKKYLGGE